MTTASRISAFLFRAALIFVGASAPVAGAQPVVNANVVNTPNVNVTNAVAVKNLADTPYYCEVSFTSVALASGDQPCPAIPAGKLVVLEYISAVATAGNATKPALVGVRANQGTQGIVVPLRYEFTNSSAFEVRVASQNIKFYVEGPASPLVYALRADGFTPQSSFSVRLVGRLQDK